VEERPKGSRRYEIIKCLQLGFPVISRKIAMEIFSLVGLALDKELSSVGEHFVMEAKGPFEEGECLVIQRNFQ